MNEKERERERVSEKENKKDMESERLQESIPSLPSAHSRGRLSLLTSVLGSVRMRNR